MKGMTVKPVVNSVERRWQYENNNPVKRKDWKCWVGNHKYVYYLSPGPNPKVKVIVQCGRCDYVGNGHTIYSWVNAVWKHLHYLAWFRATCTTCSKRFWRKFPPNKFQEHCSHYCADDDQY